MTESSWWPANYFASRNKFIELARAFGARLYAYPVAAVGPEGERLSVDVAAFTAENDEHLIVLTSGVHGIEGFMGACIQIQALAMLARTGIPDRIGIVMIHAVNPWGFAHCRRVDENNVDVNRNFIQSTGSRPVSHAQYAELDAIINPREAPRVSGEVRYWLNAVRLIARDRGIEKLFKPIAQGQYDFPLGLFFGGSEVGSSCKLLQDLVLDLSANVDQVTLLDLHSGLGPSGVTTLIGNSNRVVPEQQASWLHARYHQPVIIDNDSDNIYNAQGSFSQWCQQALSDKRFLYLCVETGTVNPIKLFSALRRENQAHHWAGDDSRSYAQTKQALLDVFAPQSLRWRRKAVAQGLLVLERSFDLPADVDGNDQ